MNPDDFARDLVVEHGPVLRRYVNRLLPGDVHRTEDIVQEIFLRACQHLESLIGRPTPRPWLYRVARNLVIDHRRRSSVLPFEEEYLDQVRQPDDLEPVLLTRLITGCLGRLPVIYCEILLLTYYFGLTQVEIAERLGVPQGTVKSRIHQGTVLARQALTESPDSVFRQVA